jgi:xanthine dehydrogenase accessory factor
VRPPTAEADIPQALVELAAEGRAFALAVVLKDTGSTPRKAGTKALIGPDGAIIGTIGGGAVEAEVQCRAVQALAAGRAVVFDFAMEGSRAADIAPICGGTMRVLIDPAAAAHAGAYAQAAEARRQRRRGVMLTTVRLGPLTEVGVRWLPAETIGPDAPFPGAEAILAALANETALLAGPDAQPAGGESCVLVEPLVPPPLLVIAGGGHVGQALARQAALVGFDLLVLDDRSEFTDPALWPPATSTHRGDMAAELARLPLGGDTYVAIVTRGHEHDRAVLAACVGSSAGYVGMIGSRRKVAMIRRDLLEGGAATREQLDRVYAPIGLDIGAETVGEIAASIVAQLIAVRRRGAANARRVGSQ